MKKEKNGSRAYWMLLFFALQFLETEVQYCFLYWSSGFKTK